MPAYNGEHETVLRPFVDAMRHKLAVNRHKGTAWERNTPTELLERIRAEVEELRDAIDRGNTVEIMLEAADIANFAMMVSHLAVKAALAGQSSDQRTLPLGEPPPRATTGVDVPAVGEDATGLATLLPSVFVEPREGETRTAALLPPIPGELREGLVIDPKPNIIRAMPRARDNTVKTDPALPPMSNGVYHIDLNPWNYELHGHWADTQLDDDIVMIWKHKKDGYLIYTDHKNVRAKNLPVAPWTVILFTKEVPPAVRIDRPDLLA